MPPTPTEIYHVQITHFELNHVIQSSLRQAKRYTRYNLLVRLYPVYTWYKPRQAKLSNGYQIPDSDDSSESLSESYPKTARIFSVPCTTDVETWLHYWESTAFKFCLPVVPQPGRPRPQDPRLTFRIGKFDGLRFGELGQRSTSSHWGHWCRARQSVRTFGPNPKC